MVAEGFWHGYGDEMTANLKRESYMCRLVIPHYALYK